MFLQQSMQFQSIGMLTPLLVLQQIRHDVQVKASQFHNIASFLKSFLFVGIGTFIVGSALGFSLGLGFSFALLFWDSFTPLSFW